MANPMLYVRLSSQSIFFVISKFIKMIQLKNRQSNSLEMAIELLQTNLKLNKMSVITNKINNFLKANDGKLEVSLKDLYQLFSEISLMEISSKNIQTGAAIIFGGNDYNFNEYDARAKIILDAAIERNINSNPSHKNDTEIDSNVKTLEKLSKSMEHSGFATKLRTISFDYAFKANTTNSSVDSLIKEADKIFNYLLSDFYSKPNNLATSSTNK